MSNIEYSYVNEKNELQYTVHRAINSDGKKFFWQTQPDGTKGLDGVTRYLYNLPKLLDTVSRGQHPVFVVEGEKSADYLNNNGCVATCSAGGSKWQWPKTWGDYFTGAYSVYVLADNDEPGRKAAEERARIIYYTNPNVKIIHFNNIDVGDDVWDWLHAGNSIDDLYRLCEESPLISLLSKPADINIEQCILSYLLSPTTVDKRELIGKITVNDFVDPFNRAVFLALYNALSISLKPDIQSVAKRVHCGLTIEVVESKLWGILGIDCDYGSVDLWLNDFLDESTKRSVQEQIRNVVNLSRNGASGASLIEAFKLSASDLRVDVVDVPVVNVETFLDGDEDVFWLQEGVFERQEKLMIVGAEGKGKMQLISQFGVKLASGIGVWSNARCDTSRVLFVDRENGANVVRRQLRRCVDEAVRMRGRGWVDNFGVESSTGGLNLKLRADQAWLESRVKSFRPDVVILAPVYKVFPDVNDEVSCVSIFNFLDDLRERYGCGYILEAHAPHENGGFGRVMRPIGSSAFKRWPTHGHGFSQVEDFPDTFKTSRFRGDRTEVELPAVLFWNPDRVKGFPWLHRDAVDEQY
jgi:AAA domain